MNNKKKKILWVGEGACLATGYGVYLKELFTRLYKTNKYELFSLDAYVEEDDFRRYDFPWCQYANMPSKNNEAGRELYRQKIDSQWGAWRFEETLLDCKSDYVLSCRDTWVDSFIFNSPLRQYFNWIVMPTVDATPQSAEWIHQFCDADALLAYSKFGAEELQRCCGNKINFRGLASPAADYAIYKPVKNKREHKEKVGIDGDSLIIGMVSRNQKRKLFPDLIKAFERFCLENPELSKNIYLYLHTAILDIGWDIGKLIRESLVGHKILLTYICFKCGKIFPSFYHDAVQSCSFCGEFAAKTPDTDHGCTTEQLSDVINCFDLYVQYAQNGGFEMTVAEAAACGVPVMCVDYSAMHSHIEVIGAIPIEVQRFYTEPESYFLKAYPNNDDLVKKLKWFFELPEMRQRQLGREIYKKCRENYDYDKATEVWMRAIDSLPPRNNWDSPAQIIEPNMEIPDIPSNYDFVQWAVINIMRRPEKINDYNTSKMVYDLHNGQVSLDSSETAFMKFGRREVINHCLGEFKKWEYWQKKRMGFIQEEPKEFILKAKNNV